MKTIKIFRSPPLDTAESFARIFDEPGAIAYACGVHAMMTMGKIIVAR
jgi:hypothetical protein